MSIERKKQYLDLLIYPSFQGVNRLFVLSFENEDDREIQKVYFLPRVEIRRLKCYDWWTKLFLINQ